MIVAICDDNTEHRNHTIQKVAEIVPSDTDFRSFSSSEALLNAVEDKLCIPDIAVLDIKFQGMDGIELAKHMNALVPNCRIIFLSGYVKYVSEVYQTEHVYFIRKEELDKYLSFALSKAIDQLNSNARGCQFISFKSHGLFESIPVSDILYFERNLRKTDIVTISSKYSVGKLPEELLGFNSDNRFIRCHQSYWVNFDWIAGLKSDSFLLKDKQQIPIRRSRSSEAKRRFLSFCSKYNIYFRSLL